MRNWKDLLNMERSNKTDIIREIFKNNYDLHRMIKKQVYLLEKYKDDFEDYMSVDDFVDEYEDMLRMIGITSEWGNDEWEWDDEADRKS